MIVGAEIEPGMGPLNAHKIDRHEAWPECRVKMEVDVPDPGADQEMGRDPCLNAVRQPQKMH